ncbi:MAG: hypothetical protein U0821_00410 [Chloroflexota bacterium]
MSDGQYGRKFEDVPWLRSLLGVLTRVESSPGPELHVALGAVPRAARVALLPGSFNPPTVAHLALARAARERGGVDACAFVLSTNTVNKERVTGAALVDRLAMLEGCLTPGREAVLLVNRGLYVEQARLIRQRLPWIREAVFLVGFDKIVQIFDPRYYVDRDAALHELFGLTSFLVAPRERAEEAELRALLDEDGNRAFAGGVEYLPLPRDLRDVSSSTVREMGRGSAEAASAVPPAVQEFMRYYGAYDASDRYQQRLNWLEGLLPA